MGRFANAQSQQDKLWVLVEATADELAQDGITDANIVGHIDRLMYVANPNAPKLLDDGSVVTPLSLALKMGATKRVVFEGMLYNGFFEFVPQTGRALRVAVENRNIEDMLQILSRRLPSSIDMRIIFLNESYIIATNNGDFRIADLLLTHGADRHTIDDETLLQIAIKYKHTVLIRAILADPMLHLTTPIVSAVVKMLRETQIDMTKVVPTNHREYFQRCLAVGESNNMWPAYQTAQSQPLPRLPEGGSVENYLRDLANRARSGIVNAGRNETADGISDMARQLVNRLRIPKN